MPDQIIGTRIRAIRQQRGLSQDALARLFGFKDRQTVSAIETGIRRVTATELLLAVERLNVPIDYFTDPFRLDGEGRFPGDGQLDRKTECRRQRTGCDLVGSAVAVGCPEAFDRSKGSIDPGTVLTK